MAGVPVYSTAFRPVSDEALRRSPFHVFASLLRLELVQNQGLRRQAEATLEHRRIFTVLAGTTGPVRPGGRAEAGQGRTDWSAAS